jgi:hypothetical protein
MLAVKSLAKKVLLDGEPGEILLRVVFQRVLFQRVLFQRSCFATVETSMLWVA